MNEIPKEYESEETYFMELCNKNQWVICEQLLRSFNKDNSLMSYKNDETGETPLMLACKENRLVIVERLLDIEVNVNSKSKDGWTALHYAAKYSNYEIVKLLLSKKADANIFENINKCLPLHLACNRTMVPSGLISNLLKVTKNGRLQKDKNGSIPIMFAVENGLILTIKELLEKDADVQINMKRKESGDKALHIACRKNDLESTRLLCEAGAAINAQNNLGQTPLHICAEENSELVLKYLYNNKANANILDNMDRNALYMAAEKGNTKLVEFLIDKYKSNILTRDKDGNTLMHITSMCGFEETTMSFLRRGVPLHMPNKKGAVCLHTAAQQGHINVVKALLEKGANVNARTKDLYTPLHIAVKYGHPGVVEILIGFGAEANCKGGLLDEFPLHISAVTDSGNNCSEMLLKSGANVNAAMKTGETVLHIVSKRGNLEMLKSLLNEGACPIIQCKEGNSSLHVAVENCHFHIVKEFVKFIDKNMNKYNVKELINQLNKNGETALHFAAKLKKDVLHSETEDVDIMKLLLENGGDLKSTNIDNDESPLHYCAAAGNSDVLGKIVQFFGKEMHGFVNKQTKNGWSPLLFASDNGHHKSVEILLENDSRVDLFDEYGMTALHLAAEKGHSEVAEILLTNKSFVNAKSKHGLTPLHMAAQNGHKILVELLIRKYSAAIDLKTLNGKTALHMAAEHGQIDVCKSLLFDKYCSPDPSAPDAKGQTPMHLAAKNDHPEVVKLFLRYKPELLMVNNLEGMNCVHLAASKGSLAVIKEFMRFNKFIIHEVRNKSTGSTPLHLAIEGGHLKVVKTLLEKGANPCDENNEGMTGLHIAAKYGHIMLLEYLKSKVNLMIESKKTGMTALHIAAHYGQIDFVRELLVEVPAYIKSKQPKTQNKESLFTDSGLTALHLAAQSGHENLVRLLLNYIGVEVDAATDTNGTIPLHLAVLNGHINVTSLLLSKSAAQLTKKDRKGRTALHLVSSHGHLEITVLLIGQGADINEKDNLGFTPLHYAAKSGYLKVCKILVESGAKCNAQTNDFNIPLIYAAKCNHTEVVSYLLHNNHSTEKLMADNKFLYDIMICSKINDFKTIEEFVLLSPAPAETAAKLSKLFIHLSEKEKERSKDLIVISEYCEKMCTDLVALAAYERGADKLLKSYDRLGVQFLDILIETEQKEVISHPSVHQYMSNVWRGNFKWSVWKFMLLIVFLSFPLSWLTALLPKTRNLFKIPVIKFIVYLFSHIYLMGLLVYVTIEKPAERNQVSPNYFECILIVWLAGLFISELVNPVDRSSIAVLRIFILAFSCVAIFVHISSYFLNESYLPEMIYIRNQILGGATFLCFVVTLDFLSFHHLFGPWTVIIRDLIGDLIRFLVFFIVFLFAFACMLAGTFQSIKEPEPEDVIPDIIDIIILLYFCLFGLVSPEDLPDPNLSPPYGNKLSKFVFGFALLMIIIVLINLLIAMMSDTYQRIQDQSDIEWKYGRAKLIRNMKNTTPIPSPFIIISQFIKIITKLYYKIKRKSISQISDEDEDEIENRLRRRSEINPNLIESSSLFKFGPDKLEEVVNWPEIARKYLEIRGITNIIINSDDLTQTLEGKNLN